RLALGEAVDAVYDFTGADVVVSLGSNFMGSGPGHLRYARQFMLRRQEAIQAGKAGMNRLYVFENFPTVTGAAADHRIPVRASDVAHIAMQLATALEVAGAQEAITGDDRRVSAIARDLSAHRGSSIVIAGAGQPPAVHAAAHAINEALGNVGKTVRYIKPV